MAVKLTLPEQHDGQKALMAVMSKFNTGGRHVWRCGRRFGKSTLVEAIAVARMARGHKVGFFAPDYKRLMPSYTAMRRMSHGVTKRASRQEMLIEMKTGGLLECWTLDDEDAGRSRSYDIVIIDEAGMRQKGLGEIFDAAIAPTLVDRNGDVIMAGTPKGVSDESFFWRACNDERMKLRWVQSHMPTAANPKLDRSAVDSLALEYPPLVYQQEFLAEFINWNGNAFFAEESLLVGGKPIPAPTFCDCVFAIVDSATKTGRDHDGTAVTYFAITKLSGLPYKLAVLDYDIVQIEGSMLEVWLPTVFQNLGNMARECGARSGSIGAFIEDKASGTILLQQAQRRNWRAHAIDSKLTSVGKDERGISTSGYVYRGEVKITEQAFRRFVNYKGNTRNHLISQVCGYRVGVKDGEDDLYDTFCYGVAIALGNSDGY